MQVLVLLNGRPVSSPCPPSIHRCLALASLAPSSSFHVTGAGSTGLLARDQLDVPNGGATLPVNYSVPPPLRKFSESARPIAAQHCSMFTAHCFMAGCLVHIGTCSSWPGRMLRYGRRPGSTPSRCAALPATTGSRNRSGCSSGHRCVQPSGPHSHRTGGATPCAAIMEARSSWCAAQVPVDLQLRDVELDGELLDGSSNSADPHSVESDNLTSACWCPLLSPILDGAEFPPRRGPGSWRDRAQPRL